MVTWMMQMTQSRQMPMPMLMTMPIPRIPKREWTVRRAGSDKRKARSDKPTARCMVDKIIASSGIPPESQTAMYIKAHSVGLEEFCFCSTALWIALWWLKIISSIIVVILAQIWPSFPYSDWLSRWRSPLPLSRGLSTDSASTSWLLRHHIREQSQTVLDSILQLCTPKDRPMTRLRSKGVAIIISPTTDDWQVGCDWHGCNPPPCGVATRTWSTALQREPVRTIPRAGYTWCLDSAVSCLALLLLCLLDLCVRACVCVWEGVCEW